MSAPVRVSALERAQVAWAAEIPAWIEALAQACDQSSQAKVARAIGYSAAVVSTVLAGTYAGDMASVERAVRAALMGETVNCPVLGEIPATDCRQHQGRPYRNTNALRVRLWQACQTCRFNHARRGSA